MTTRGHHGLLLGGAGGGGAASTWDSTAKGAGIVLSNGDLDATKASGGWNTVLGTNSRASGKYQFEIEAVAGAPNVFAGIADREHVGTLVSNYLGNDTAGPNVISSVGYWAQGYIYINVTGSATYYAVATWGVGDVITVDLDLVTDDGTATPRVIFYKNDTLVLAVNLPSGKVWYPGTSVQSGGKTRLRASSLVHPHSGFAEWG